MPPRSRRSQPMATFDLVPDDDHDGSAPLDDDEGRRRASLGIRAAARWRGLSRRGRVAVAATTAVVVAGAATAVVLPGQLEARADRQRAEAVQGLPGAVADLSEPLEETWTLPSSVQLAAVLPGGLLVVSDGSDVTAVDGETGDEVWTRHVDGGATCGPTPEAEAPADWSRPTESIVCVSGDGSEVTVLDGAGEVVGERQLDVPDDTATGAQTWPVVSPAADGAVAVVDGATGATVPWEQGDDPEHAIEALRDAGWTDPTLRVEDALTGEVRAETTIPLHAADLEYCGYTEDEQGNTSLSPELSVQATPTSTIATLCSTARAVTPDGSVIELGTGSRSLYPRPGGGFVVPGETSDVLDESGAVQSRVSGWVLPVPVDTEPDGPSIGVLAASGSNSSLAAVGDDGEPLWTSRTAMLSEVLARADGTLVVAEEGAVVGLDSASGEERWRADGLVGSGSDGVTEGEHVAGVVTDGTRLLLAIAPDTWSDDPDSASRRLVALDLDDGTTVWERSGPGDLWGLHSVDGHPVISASRFSGLG